MHLTWVIMFYIWQQSCEVSAIVISSLQRIWRFRELGQLTEVHMANKWWHWHLSPDLAEYIEPGCLEQQFPSYADTVCWEGLVAWHSQPCVCIHPWTAMWVGKFVHQSWPSSLFWGNLWLLLDLKFSLVKGNNISMDLGIEEGLETLGQPDSPWLLARLLVTSYFWSNPV